MIESKCPICEYKTISDILLYDTVVQKCSRCDFIRVSTIEYSNLMYKVLYSLNIGHLKSYINIEDMDKNDADRLRKFISIVDLSSFNCTRKSTGTCNVCREALNELSNKYFKFFKIYYCIGCNSVYFDKKNFIEFVDFLTEVNKPFSFLRFLKEIFHFRKVKNNAKE